MVSALLGGGARLRVRLGVRARGIDRGQRGSAEKRRGTALLAALIEDARRQGHSSLSLSVLRENPAVRLYERFGFRLVEVTGEHQTLRLDFSVEER